jgi:hypothetical protein
MIENPALAVCIEHKGKILKSRLFHILRPPEEFIQSPGLQVNPSAIPFAAEGLLMYKRTICGQGLAF